ncbi:MAG: 30S ribosomal protein S20 [Armatimonadetes bacterium]|nr:30S ribosomal protein S20 [Armatimonadota bacterium]
MRSGLKRRRQSIRRGVRNQAARSEVKTMVRKARGGQATAVKTAAKALDKAASKGILHKNAAARKKSRIMKAAAKSK